MFVGFTELKVRKKKLKHGTDYSIPRGAMSKYQSALLEVVSSVYVYLPKLRKPLSYL